MTDGADWHVTTPLLPHQQEAVAKLLPTRVGALFAEMGTGKTLTALMLAWLRRAKIDRVLWFGPVSSKATIQGQILLHTDCQPADILLFDERTTAATAPRRWNLIGIESVSGSARVYLAARAMVGERCMVVVDESHTIKGHRALRTERLTALARPARYRLILTGTPVSQGLEDLFAQMRFLSPEILGYSSFWTFANNHLVYSTRFPGLIERTKNADHLAQQIKPYVYQITKDECLTLPPKLQADRWCDLTPDQASAYRDAKERILHEDYLWGEDWERRVAIYRLFTVLQGISCGFERGADGEVYAIAHNRLTLLHDALAGLDPAERVVIWARYHFAVDEIAAALVAAHGPAAVAILDGRVPAPRRETVLTAWRQGGRYLVATQGVGGQSIDLTAARYVVFYANSFRYADRQQAEDRCHRIGQARPVTYVSLWAGAGIESRIQRALAAKGNAVTAFREEVNRVRRSNKERLRALVAAL